MSDLKITPTSNYAKLNCIHIDQLRTCTLSIYLSIYIYSVCVYIYIEREVDIQYMCIMFGSNMQLTHIRSVEAKIQHV